MAAEEHTDGEYAELWAEGVLSGKRSLTELSPAAKGYLYILNFALGMLELDPWFLFQFTGQNLGLALGEDFFETLAISAFAELREEGEEAMEAGRQMLADWLENQKIRAVDNLPKS